MRRLAGWASSHRAEEHDGLNDQRERTALLRLNTTSAFCDPFAIVQSGDFLMPTVTDPSGRQWIVEEIGLAGNAVNLRPGERLPEFTLATLRVTSEDEKFVVSIGRSWRELSNDDL